MEERTIWMLGAVILFLLAMLIIMSLGRKAIELMQVI